VDFFCRGLHAGAAAGFFGFGYCTGVAYILLRKNESKK